MVVGVEVEGDGGRVDVESEGARSEEGLFED